MSKEYIGHISRLFGQGQKQNGWFSGIFETDEHPYSLHVAGVYKNDIDMNVEYKIIADETVDQKYGKQFKIKSILPHVCMTRSSIVGYLSSNSFKGIGPTIANKIFDEFELDSLEVISNSPEKLISILNLTEKQVHILISGYASQSIENQLRKLIPDISENLLNKIIEHYCEDGTCGSNDVISLIKTSPYQLLYDLSNVDFKDIDKIAIDIGFGIYNDVRINECYKSAVYQYINNTGNVYIDTSDLNIYNQFYSKVLDNVGYIDMVNDFNYSQRCFDVVNEMFMHPESVYGISTDFNDTNILAIYDEKTYESECGLSEFFANQLISPSVFIKTTGCTVSDIEDCIDLYEMKKKKDKNNFKLDDSQRNAVIFSLMSSTSIINGGPGHGKTSVIECILFIWDRLMLAINCEKAPVLAAPTGRAVAVLKHAVGINHEDDVATIMRRIYTVGKIKKDINRLKRNHESTREKESELSDIKESYTNALVVIDECSMVGVNTAYDFSELFTDCQFIFVGDVDQLPSIECGQFFKDICDCGLIMKSELTENHRSEGIIIVENAGKINSGDVDNIDFTDDSHFSMMPCTGDYSNVLIVEYLSFVMPNSVLDLDTLMNICILCPTSKGPTGSLLLNVSIQDIVNPLNIHAKTDERGYEISNTHMYIDKDHKDVKLRVGDRIMQTKNNMNIVCETNRGAKHRETFGIFNGDSGIITQVIPFSSNKEAVEVLFDDGRKAVLEDDCMKHITLAYAITIHKSQGSEYEVVIISSQESMLYIPGDFTCRNLLYTAVTRAKKYVRIIGSHGAFCKCIITEKNPRNSMLRHRIINAFSLLKKA